MLAGIGGSGGGDVSDEVREDELNDDGPKKSFGSVLTFITVSNVG